MTRTLLFLVLVGCSSGSSKTPDGGTIYTSIPPDNIPCTTDSDCCVVTDSCRSAAYVVHAGDQVKMPSTACNLCIVPAVQVWCKAGVCQSGELHNLSSDTAPFMQDHCGSLPLPDAGDNTLYGPDGGVVTMAAYGCNP
jgi:hypothetical protein